MTLDSPIVCRNRLGRNEVRIVTLEYGRGRGWQIQQFIIKSLGRLWCIVEEYYPKQGLFDLCKLKLLYEAAGLTEPLL
jgi:hypothetical protein